MAKQERIKRQGSEELEEESRYKKRANQPLHDQLKAPDEGVADFTVEPSLDRHASLLADVHSDEQRAKLTTQLQQSYGNTYVQQVMERIQAQKGSGKPLESETRSEMETAFKQDFGDVRIHADGAAGKLTKELGARAFTTGKDIFFGEGTYQPGSEAGKGLLGHELTHVVQQERGTQAGDTVSQVGDAWEREAAWMGQVVSEGLQVSVGMVPPAPTLQRQAAPEATAEDIYAEEETLSPLRAMWEAAVVRPIQDAYDALSGEKPDVKLAYDKIGTATGVLLDLKPSYEGQEPINSRLRELYHYLFDMSKTLAPHVGITISMEQIRSEVNPKGEFMPAFLDRIRGLL